MGRKQHVTMTFTSEDLKRWLAQNFLEVPTQDGTLTFVAIPRHITNVSQLATYIKYDLLIDHHPLLVDGIDAE